MLYTTFARFKNNCAEDAGNRLFEEVMASPKELKVELRTKLYPNPNSGTFVIAVAGLKEDKRVEIIIYDLLGKLIYSETKTAGDNNTLQLNPGLVNGTYIIKIKLSDLTFDIHKLIIEK